MRKVYEQITRVGPTDTPVLILGETGTGKELVAEAIHRASGRGGQFVAVNCGSLSRDLAGSELFGHEKGSFTGAVRRHPGFFKRSDSGTLFLDELAEMPLDLQPHFLRVLETGAVLPVGAEKETYVDTRIVAATNTEPKKAIADKTLREDLYYRLNVFPIALPPLRDREDDALLLADQILESLNAAQGTSKRLSDAARERIRAYPWRGNVRELRNEMQRAFIIYENLIEFPGLITERMDAPSASEVGVSLDESERSLILATLEHCSGDKKRAAQILGISLKTLYNRLHLYSER
jgi:DNA-binding NtrC family response regulator